MSVDLVPSVTSRTVTIDVTTLTEDEGIKGAWVDFRLLCDLHVMPDDKIIAAGVTRVHLVEGKAEVRLPCYDPDAITQEGRADWGLVVTKSWHPSHPYLIRVPAGTGSISLADIPPVAELTGPNAQYAITNVVVNVAAGDTPSGSATYNNGLLTLNITAPKGDKGDTGPASNTVADGTVTLAKLAADVKTSFSRGVNVRDYGAKGDGSTDDTAAIKAAAAAAGMGGLVWFPAGTYATSGTVTVMQNQRWLGPAMNMDGSNATGAIIQSKSTMVTPIVQASPASTIESLSIYGVGANVAGHVGIDMTKISSVTLRDVSVWRCETGIKASELWYGEFDRIFLWKNKTALALDYCYNINLHTPRIQCQMDDATRGVGITMNNRTWATIHGGTVEQYTSGIEVGFKCHLTAIGLYQESAHPGCSGIRVTNGTSTQVTLTGCQVYVTNHKAWVDCTTARPHQLVSHGNSFHGGSSATEYAYCWDGSTGGMRAFLHSDTWEVAGGARWCSEAPLGGSGLIAPPYGAGAYGDLSITDGRTLMSGSLNVQGVITPKAGLTSERPAMLPEQRGSMMWDTTLTRPIWWTGTRWIDATGTTV